MGRMYTIPFDSFNSTTADDFFEILVPSDSIMILHEIKVTQSSDAGDAESEQIEFTIKRGVGSITSGSGGASQTPVKMQTGDAAAGITAEVKNTTQASAGTGSLTTLMTINENIHAGLHYLPTPECRLVFSPSEYCIVSITTAPADSLTFDGYAIVEEIGG